jgi:hypothetical protein
MKRLEDIRRRFKLYGDEIPLSVCRVYIEHLNLMIKHSTDETFRSEAKNLMNEFVATSKIVSEGRC